MQNSKQKIGLFGGTFNPLHMGHINSMVSLSERMQFDHLFAIPANKNPLKEISRELPSGEVRLEMVKRGLQDYGDKISVDEREIQRGGESYTIDTINEYIKHYPSDELFLITGLDEFMVFDQWRDFDTILSKANLVVTSRPGVQMPITIEQLPKGIQKLVAAYDRDYIELTTGQNIQLVTLEDIDISASEIRKRIRTGKNVERFLPLSVEDYIKEKGLYRSSGPKVANYDELTALAAKVLFKHKGIQVRGFDLREIEAPCEYSLIASGTSTRHAQSLADHVIQAAKDEYGLSPVSVEGQKDGRWVLVDYGSLIVHVFYDYVRAEYQLEELWREGKDLGFLDPFAEGAADSDSAE